MQRRSDGRVTLTAGYGQDLGATAGIGVHLGPVVAGGTADAGAGFRSGRTWVLTEQRLRALLAQTGGDPNRARLTLPLALGPPAETFLEGGGAGGAELALEAIREIPGAGVRARAALGRRTSPEGTTYYLDLGAGSAGPIADVVPGLDVQGRAVAEYRDRRSAGRSRCERLARDHDGDEVETVLRLPLRTEADAAAARRVAFLDLADPASAMHDLIARVHARGTVERLRYRTSEEGSAWAYGLELGVKLGADRTTSVLRRELVAAQVLNGALPASREDCLHFADAVRAMPSGGRARVGRSALSRRRADP